MSAKDTDRHSVRAGELEGYGSQSRPILVTHHYRRWGGRDTLTKERPYRSATPEVPPKPPTRTLPSRWKELSGADGRKSVAEDFSSVPIPHMREVERGRSAAGEAPRQEPY